MSQVSIGNLAAYGAVTLHRKQTELDQGVIDCPACNKVKTLSFTLVGNGEVKVKCGGCEVDITG